MVSCGIVQQVKKNGALDSKWAPPRVPKSRHPKRRKRSSPMEESLRELLERLSGSATGGANGHDKPSNVVEEVKEILEYLAEDELPAASAILLAKVRASRHPTMRTLQSERNKERERSGPVTPPRAPASHSLVHSSDTPGFDAAPKLTPPDAPRPNHDRNDDERRTPERRRTRPARCATWTW